MSRMNPRAVLILAFILLSLVPASQATSDCPASQPYFGPYNKIEIFNANGDIKGYKLVDEPFTIKATHIDGDEIRSLSNQAVKIYYYEDGTKETLVDQGKTNSNGEYKYTPTKTGKYKIECGGRAPILEIKKLLQPGDMGAVCGDGTCDSGKLETRDNCPIDCTECGDAICEGSENKDSCPEDCIICGDGECDPEEYSPTGCSCPVDCVICGDGSCDSAHGETSQSCAKDCGGAAPVVKVSEDGGIVQTLTDNWLILAIVCGAIIGYYVYKRRKEGKTEYSDTWEAPTKKEKKKAKKSGALESDDEMMDIINELMDSGISDKRLKGKLEEFGVDGNDAKDLIKKAKKKK